MQIDMLTSGLVALVAVNLVLCLYLARVVSRIRGGLGRAGTADLAVRAEADSEILARVAAEIEVAVDEVTRAGAEAEERLSALEARCDDLAQRMETLAIPLPQAPGGAVERGEAAPAPAERPGEDASEPVAPRTVVPGAPGVRTPHPHARAGYRAVTEFAERHARVVSLREQGKGLAEIARITRMSEGEVEFVLGVRDRLPRQATGVGPETNTPD